MPSQSKIKDFCQLSHRESQAYDKLKFETNIHQKPRSKRRSPIGIHTLQNGSFPAILQQKIMAGVSLAMIFYFVLRKNLSLWSALQF